MAKQIVMVPPDFYQVLRSIERALTQMKMLKGGGLVAYKSYAGSGYVLSMNGAQVGYYATALSCALELVGRSEGIALEVLE